MSEQNTETSNVLTKPRRGSAINTVFVFFLLSAVLIGAANNKLQEVSDASFESAKGAVMLAVSLIGIMALWLGFMRVLEAGGLMHTIARIVKPVMTRLFPEVPSDHPAMSAMMLNISANMLGLGNAATPFGIRAMGELNRLNPLPGTATNAMCLFLAINTSSVTLLPLGVIGVRAAAGCANPAGIFLPTFLATCCSTFVAVSVAMFLARFANLSSKQKSQINGEKIGAESKVPDASFEMPDYSHLQGQRSISGTVIAWGCFCAFCFMAIVFTLRSENSLSFVSSELCTYWLMPGLILLIVSYGIGSGVHVYESVTEGAKQGFEIAVRIIPYLVAILVAVGVFRASGAMDLAGILVSPITNAIGMPMEVLPMALVRPLSGSGAFAVMSAIIEAAPDSYESFLASVMMGSTETTFYVIAVYFGAVGVGNVRHALVAALCADVAGILAACKIAPLFFY